MFNQVNIVHSRNVYILITLLPRPFPQVSCRFRGDIGARPRPRRRRARLTLTAEKQVYAIAG